MGKRAASEEGRKRGPEREAAKRSWTIRVEGWAQQDSPGLGCLEGGGWRSEARLPVSLAGLPPKTRGPRRRAEEEPNSRSPALARLCPRVLRASPAAALQTAPGPHLPAFQRRPGRSPTKVQQGPSGGRSALCRPAKEVELRERARLLGLHVFQVEAPHQEVLAPNVLRHQVHLPRSAFRA